MLAPLRPPDLVRSGGTECPFAERTNPKERGLVEEVFWDFLLMLKLKLHSVYVCGERKRTVRFAAFETDVIARRIASGSPTRTACFFARVRAV